MITPRDAVVLLEQADPVDPLQIADENDIAAAHVRVRRLIADAPETRAWGSPAPTRSRRRATRVATLIAAGVAVLSLLVAVLPGRGRRSGLGPLTAAAAVAATQPSTIAPPGRYFHVLERLYAFAPLGQRSNVEVSYEWWVAANGSGRLVYRTAPWGPGSAFPGCGCRQSGNELVVDRRFGPGRFDDVYRRYVELGVAHPVDPSSLPVSPSALTRELERRGDLQLPQIAWLLADPMDSPALRSALFRVAAKLRGVIVQAHVTDPAGRIGEAMTVSGRLRYRVIFDPRTSQILAWEIASTGHATTWVRWRTFLGRRIVSSTHSVR